MACGFMSFGESPSAAAAVPSPTVLHRPAHLQPLDDPQKEIDKLTLYKVVKDEYLVPLFEEFARRELCVENFLFWKEIEGYKDLLSPEQRKKRFEEIFSKYISQESHMEMNMSGEDRILFNRTMASGEAPSEDIFDNIQLGVWIEMNTELFPRFIRSDLLHRFFFERAESPSKEQSRKKLEDFFGMELKGSIKRKEVVKVVATTGYQKSEGKRALGRRHSMTSISRGVSGGSTTASVKDLKKTSSTNGRQAYSIKRTTSETSIKNKGVISRSVPSGQMSPQDRKEWLKQQSLQQSCSSSSNGGQGRASPRVVRTSSHANVDSPSSYSNSPSPTIQPGMFRPRGNVSPHSLASGSGSSSSSSPRADSYLVKKAISHPDAAGQLLTGSSRREPGSPGSWLVKPKKTPRPTIIEERQSFFGSARNITDSR